MSLFTGKISFPGYTENDVLYEKCLIEKGGIKNCVDRIRKDNRV